MEKHSERTRSDKRDPQSMQHFSVNQLLQLVGRNCPWYRSIEIYQSTKVRLPKLWCMSEVAHFLCSLPQCKIGKSAALSSTVSLLICSMPTHNPDAASANQTWPVVACWLQMIASISEHQPCRADAAIPGVVQAAPGATLADSWLCDTAQGL